MLFIEEIHMNNTVAIICFTESCVMFFSPSRAVLSAILRDEYLTSAVRTKEGDLSPSLVCLWSTIEKYHNVRSSTYDPSEHK